MLQQSTFYALEVDYLGYTISWRDHALEEGDRHPCYQERARQISLSRSWRKWDLQDSQSWEEGRRLC